MQDVMLKAKRKKPSVINSLVLIIFIVYAIGLIIPYLLGFMISLKTPGEYYNTKILELPGSFNLANYVEAWKGMGAIGQSIPSMLLNSIWYAGGMAAFSVLFSSMSAYVVAKYKFPGKSVIYSFALITMMIPIMGSLPSQLKYLKVLNALNSPIYVLFMCQVIGMIFIVMLSAFKGVSWEYAEAAFIDGAGPFLVFFRVMLPQVMPVMIAMFLTNFVYLWADGEAPLIFFDRLPPLALGLLFYKEKVDANFFGTSIPIFFSGLMVCMVPTIILFSVFQKTLMEIQMGGGIKG